MTFGSALRSSGEPSTSAKYVPSVEAFTVAFGNRAANSEKSWRTWQREREATVSQREREATVSQREREATVTYYWYHRHTYE